MHGTNMKIEWSTSRPGHITREGRAAGTHCRGDCVGVRNGADGVKERQFIKLH